MNADAEVIIEQALRHVLMEQQSLLQRKDLLALIEIIRLLNTLAIETQATMSSGISLQKSVQKLLKLARDVEKACDDLSEEMWAHIPVSVSAVFERLENSLQRSQEKRNPSAELRSYYQNIRFRLLEQTLGARTLRPNSDLGDEVERIWQQFLQNSLGDSVRVLRGGIVCDHDGNYSKHQIDLIVVPAKAYVIFPGGSDGGKAHVPIDQVISVIMVSSTLTGDKLRTDWENLADIPSYSQLAEDHPSLRQRKTGYTAPWPLRYIVGAQSDPIELLMKAWKDAVNKNLGPTPEFVVTLDSGYLYSGVTGWPKPCYPANYITAEDVYSETGIFRGLGLAWLLTQHRGRLAVIQRRAIQPIVRQANALDKASMKDGTPVTYSPRFQSWFRMGKISEGLHWGRVSTHAHNRLPLNTIDSNEGFPLCLPGIDPKIVDYPYIGNVRWFHYSIVHKHNEMVAFEEWLNPKCKDTHSKRIAVFSTVTGEEITGSKIESLRTPQDIEGLNI